MCVCVCVCVCRTTVRTLWCKMCLTAVNDRVISVGTTVKSGAVVSVCPTIMCNFMMIFLELRELREKECKYIN